MKKCKLALVGIGGMGDTHLRLIRHMVDQNRAELVAVCDINLDRYIANLKQYDFSHVRQYRDYNEFLSSGQEIDLIVISTPIPLHKSMLQNALAAGYDVLLEKPPAVTIQDIDEMINTEQESGRRCVVAFQHTAEQSFVCLKDRIAAGEIGNIQAVSALGIWKRNQGYFDRTPWAGKIKLNGNYVLDGTINNPFAHLLNNSLILAGVNGNGEPESVCAELYRANAIESEDTSCLHARLKNGVDVFFSATIAAWDQETPFIRVYGSEGSAYWNYNGDIRLYHKDCDTPYETLTLKSDAGIDLYENVLDYFSGKSDTVCCPLKMTRSFVLASNLAFESSHLSHQIDYNYIAKMADGECEAIVIKNINDILKTAICKKKLLSECDVPWSVKTQPFFVDGYNYFGL